MFSFKEIPFIKLLLPFILGIISGIYSPQIDWHFLFNIMLIWLVFLIYSHKKWGKNYHKRILVGGLLFTGFFLMGIMNVNYHRPQSENKKSIFIVSNSWKANAKYFKAEALIESDNKFLNPGKVMLYIPKDSTLKLPGIGERLITSRKITTVSGPKNPFQFDYAAYLLQKGIVGNVYLQKADFINGGQSHRFSARRKFNRLKLKFTQIIDDQPMSPETKALLQALLLGEKSNLDPEIKRAYTSAGAMHVLAVSGLHVGIVLLFINFFFKIFEFKKRGKPYLIIKSIITLVIIWIFAGITGFSPSITRATTMFSFLVVGKALNRNTNIYNSLAIAAFVLLFFNPFALQAVGFQLSFLAVFGIVFFHPKIFTLLYFKHLLLRKSWELTSVSLSAQLSTFPIALLYFHQFPVYFLISNLVVIPFAFIIVISGLILLMVSPFETLSGGVAFALDHVVHLLNFLVLKVEELPFYKIGGVSINITETIMLYGSIAFITAFFLVKNVRFLISSLLILIMLFSHGLYKKLQYAKRNEVNFYSIYNHTAIDIVQQNRHVFIADSLLLNQDSKIGFYCGNHWNASGLSPIGKSPKATLGKAIENPEMKLIISKRHILYKNTLICLNHSSHSDGDIQPAKYRVLLLNRWADNSSLTPVDYPIILLNFNKFDANNTAEITNALNAPNNRIHNLLTQGFISINR